MCQTWKFRFDMENEVKRDELKGGVDKKKCHEINHIHCSFRIYSKERRQIYALPVSTKSLMLIIWLVLLWIHSRMYCMYISCNVSVVAFTWELLDWRRTYFLTLPKIGHAWDGSKFDVRTFQRLSFVFCFCVKDS